MASQYFSSLISVTAPGKAICAALRFRSSACASASGPVGAAAPGPPGGVGREAAGASHGRRERGSTMRSYCAREAGLRNVS